jgi:hypothetical protein
MKRNFSELSKKDKQKFINALAALDRQIKSLSKKSAQYDKSLKKLENKYNFN